MQKFLQSMRGGIFDLDGVIVDTAKFHYLAWKRLANELGFEFTEAHNERLKGVSRMRSLEILLEVGGLNFPDAKKQEMAARKNAWYVEYIRRMDASELLPGSHDYLVALRQRGVRIALASARKNAPLILARVKIASLFDAVVDGNRAHKAKPDPQAFLLAASDIGMAPADCVVFEDAEAGVAAAKNAGMRVVGIGKPENLRDADLVVANLGCLLPQG